MMAEKVYALLIIHLFHLNVIVVAQTPQVNKTAWLTTSTPVLAAGNFGIVEPFPNNIYAVEFASGQVTCVAFDSTGLKNPQEILFVRRNRFAEYTILKADDRLYFTNYTVEVVKGGTTSKKLYVTMHIKNVTAGDDSQAGELGRYECHAYAVGDSWAQGRHGFSVNVFKRSELPIVSVSKVDVLKKGEVVTIICNVTQVTHRGRFGIILWYKDGLLLRYMRFNHLKSSLPLVVSVGGNYSCVLDVLLAWHIGFNVSDSVKILYAPFCLEEKSEGVVWTNTSSGGTDFKPCPQGSIGTASRYCSENGTWSAENFTSCRSAEFIKLNEVMDAILDNRTSGMNVNEVLSNLESALRPVASKPNYSQRINGGDLIMAVDLLSKIAKYNQQHGSVSSALDVKKFAQVANSLLEANNRQTWQELDEVGRGRGAILVQTMDTYGLGVAATFNESKQQQVVTEKNLLLRIDRVGQNSQIGVNGMEVSFNKSSVYLPPQAFSSSTDSFVVSIIYRTLNDILLLSKDPDASSDDVIIANTSIVSSTVMPEPPNVLTKPINIVLENIKTSFRLGSIPQGKCMFWKPGEAKNWNTRGCWLVTRKSNFEVTTCECNHLTVFAALMDPYGRTETKSHKEALEIISTVGCSISLVAVAITIAVHVLFWRILRSPRTKVLLNLCAAVAISCILVISEKSARSKTLLCTVVAALLHYFLLSLFSWMLCEGMLHYMLLVRVLRSVAGGQINFFYIFGWGFPAAVVAISLVVTQGGGYGGSDVCWLDVKNGVIWAFIGPALLVVLVNIIVFILVIRNMLGTASMQGKTQIEQVKAGIKASAVILPLLGITWSFGLLSFNSDTIAFKYIFAVFNSLQGLALFVFHCLFNKQVRDAFKREKQKKKTVLSLKSGRRIEQKISTNQDENRRSGANPTNEEMLAAMTIFDYEESKSHGLKYKDEGNLTCAVVHHVAISKDIANVK